ncbi:MAG: hypothetical protein M1819_005719 [Sarea resinae]|nr:MAG: hypothetical protein M1819_005719 [Sarea resinae]
MVILRQTWTLTAKTLRIVLVRHAFTTILRALLLPIAFFIFLAYAKNLFVPPATYGIGHPSPVKNLTEILKSHPGGRDRIAFVNSGFTGGNIERIINIVSAPAKDAGFEVQILAREEELLTACHSSLRGVSRCFGAAVFYSSPTEGLGGIWNYTLRADGSLGSNLHVDKSTNDVEKYPLPFQHAIDFGIASINSTVDYHALPPEIMEYPYTSESNHERHVQVRIHYMKALINILGVAFFVGVVGVTYQLVGFMAYERELGMSQLIEAMMPNVRRWQPQFARLMSHHIAFDIIYFPAWLIMGFIAAYGVFQQTSPAIVIVTHLLIGLSLSSLSIFGGVFFKKAQLSGITMVMICIILAILAQVLTYSSGAVAILSLLFPPMNYTFFILLMARWEHQDLGVNLVKSAPDNPWGLPGIVLWVFMAIQILAFPLLGALVERALYSTSCEGRSLSQNHDDKRAVQLNGFSKSYPPNWFYRHVAPVFGKSRETVVAVDNLTLDALEGQILVLLGANGSGKSTTLDAIAGLSRVTSGSIEVDGRGGLGMCPQKNVLWDDLTVEEHVQIFNRLKSVETTDSKTAIQSLITACDLDRKLGAKSKTLSGGQKRKLQLSMMFTGGSRVCCVDEASSGLDPLSRRKIWDILLAERGLRTIILTTHFLDEADLLSDHIAVLSRGVLKADGSAVELKHKLGGGYRVHVHNDLEKKALQTIEGPPAKHLYDQTIYNLPDSAGAMRFINRLEESGIRDYQVNGPTIEDVFLKLAEEVKTDLPSLKTSPPGSSLDGKFKEGSVMIAEDQATDTDSENSELNLLPGKQIRMTSQAWILFRKRLTILRRNFLPYGVALLVPVIAAGCVTLFLKDFHGAGCSPSQQVSTSDVDSLLTITDAGHQLLLAPSSRIPSDSLLRYYSTLPPADGPYAVSSSTFLRSVHTVNTSTQFTGLIDTDYAIVTPGGAFLGDDQSPTTFAYKINGGIQTAVITQNVLDNLLTNISISTQYAEFDIPWAPKTGKTLQLVVYFGLAMAVYPSFFALYPTVERLRNVRALHYSNGVRILPLWLAYISFDFLLVLVASVLVIIIFAASSSVWYHIAYLFPVFFLYGLASTLLGYVISLFSTSQLATFAMAAGGQAVMFLIYFIAYLCVLTYAPPQKIDYSVNVAYFTIASITPAGNLARAMLVSLNVFSIVCRDRSVASNPGDMTLYGGPILYLILQSLFLFGVLLWWDSGSTIQRFRKTVHSEDIEDTGLQDDEVATKKSQNGLRVAHVSKSFGGSVAVEDVTFSVGRGEVFALLGPNGAGKSTTISLIRGDIQPSYRGGEIFIENIPLSKHRAAARQSLGVCPQFEAMDQMTVLEHLRFYARIRGVDDIEHNVREVIRAVGLKAFSSRMAAKLSGGNKRKLSLGIALMGNPSVLLLDEPSSGMDAASKRVMWRTLSSIVPGRSLVLTTHSMEEADALADRAGIMAKRMLALGTSDHLRRTYGNAYYVHLVTKSAPHTPAEEMDRIKRWILERFEGAVVEDKTTCHGQMRFKLPAESEHSLEPPPYASSSVEKEGAASKRGGGISALFTALEGQKEDLDLQYYSVSRSTLDQVFLSIVGQYNVEEENYRSQESDGIRAWWHFSGPKFWRRF